MDTTLLKWTSHLCSQVPDSSQAEAGKLLKHPLQFLQSHQPQTIPSLIKRKYKRMVSKDIKKNNS